MKKYSFSRDKGATAIGMMVSPELRSRIALLCNTLEMSQSSLLRYLITRGVDELETKLTQRIQKMRAADKGASAP